MIRYYCHTCQSYIEPKLIDKNTNKCLICKENLKGVIDKYGDSTNLQEKKILYDARLGYNNSYVKHEYKIYWSHNGNVPIFDQYCSKYNEECEYMATDLRPVFPEEQLLIQILLGESIKILNQSVWNAGGKYYIINGEKIKILKSELMKKDPVLVLEEYNKRINEIDYIKYDNIISEFVELNREWYNQIKNEAINNITRVSGDYNEDEMFVSFSGGKDSTVVDDLVRKALPHRIIKKIFGDTTLEFPSTYDYIERTKNNQYNSQYSKVLTAKNNHDNFYELCEIVGPPSRVLRWCCTYFKTTPISDRIDRLFSDKNKVLTFYGIRRSESNSRSKYDMETDSPKILKQRVFAPIIDWVDFDVWLYILSSHVDFNSAYRRGYSRVGCWNCPNNNDWDLFLSKVFMPQISQKWQNTLMDFAIKTNKVDPEEYVENNHWKARQGGNGLHISDNAIINFQPCVLEANSYNYHLTKPISNDLYNLFIPFGFVDMDNGNKRKGEVFIVSKNNIPCIKLQGRVGTDLLKVTILNINEMGGVSNRLKNIEDAKKKIDCQITKYQTCIACSGCKSACRFDAIKISNKTTFNEITGDYDIDVLYTIDNNKCVRCGECIDHFDSGCYMKKVLRTKRSD